MTHRPQDKCPTNGVYTPLQQIMKLFACRELLHPKGYLRSNKAEHSVVVALCRKRLSTIVSTFQMWEWLALGAVFAAGMAAGRTFLLERRYEVHTRFNPLDTHYSACGRTIIRIPSNHT